MGDECEYFDGVVGLCCAWGQENLDDMISLSFNRVGGSIQET